MQRRSSIGDMWSCGADVFTVSGEFICWLRHRRFAGSGAGGQHENSIMPKIFEEFISLTLRTRNSKKSLRMLARNWKWLLLCFARLARNASIGRPEARLMSSNQNLRVSWKPVNPQDRVWKNLHLNIMQTILREKETIHYSITIQYTNLFLCLKP